MFDSFKKAFGINSIYSSHICEKDFSINIVNDFFKKTILFIYFRANHLEHSMKLLVLLMIQIIA